MSQFSFKSKMWEIDPQGFLTDFRDWEESFAEGMALHLGMVGGLTKEHWDVITSLRDHFHTTGKCMTVYDCCRQNGLRLKDLRRLFPSGYLRGACKLAGITYRESQTGNGYSLAAAEDLNNISANKTYETDVRGFLVHADEWDQYFAAFRAQDMKIPGGKLNDKHWEVIKFLREYFEKNDRVPTVYETCEACGIDLDELERLFPDGYHRGAVKIAGLRVR